MVKKKVVVFVGYDSKSYELVRKLRFINLGFDLELIHIPSYDEGILTEVTLPSIMVEYVDGSKIRREELRSVSQLNMYLELISDRVPNTLLT